MKIKTPEYLQEVKVQNLISELERMCMDIDFDRNEALHIVRRLDLNRVFLSSTDRHGFSYKTTFLEEAVESYNIPMVELLLQNGADPNFIDPNGEADHVFMTMLCRDFERKENNYKRLEIIELMLRYGADPNSKDFDDEPILDHATDIYSEFADDFAEPKYVYTLEYLERFIIMLVAYGGDSRYFPVKVLQPLDKNNLGQYRLKNILPFLKKVSLGVIVDGEGNTVAYV